jgi:hypothetical protein
LRLGPALRAYGRCDLRQVALAQVIHAARLGLDLFAGGLRLGRRDFLVEIRRARLAQPAFLFQQIGSHTQFPQRVHCLKMGLISRTAAFRAESCCEPATIDCSWSVVRAAPKMPPRRDAATFAAADAAPSLLASNVDM